MLPPRRTSSDRVFRPLCHFSPIGFHVTRRMRACAMYDLSLSAGERWILMSTPCSTWPIKKICSCVARDSYCNITFTIWLREPFDSYKTVDSFCLPHVTSLAFIGQFSFQLLKQMTVAVISLDLLKAQSTQTVTNQIFTF